MFDTNTLMIASVVVVAKSWVLLSIVLLNSICQPFRPSDLQGGKIFIMPQFSFHSYLRGWVLDFGIHTIPFNIRFQMPVSISESWIQFCINLMMLIPINTSKLPTRVVSQRAFAQSSITACTAKFAACSVQCGRWKG